MDGLEWRDFGNSYSKGFVLCKIGAPLYWSPFHQVGIVQSVGGKPNSWRWAMLGEDGYAMGWHEASSLEEARWQVERAIMVGNITGEKPWQAACSG